MSRSRYSVIDADVHIYERDGDLAPYFDQPWRQVLEQGGLTREGARNVTAERFLDLPGSSPRTIYDPILVPLPTSEPVRLATADALRADLDRRGIDAAIIFTGRLLRAATSNDYHYISALQRAFNRYLAERWVDPSRGIYAAIMAANQLPEEAADEISCFARVPGFVAVYLPLAGNYPLWGDRGYDPIFAAAQAADLPVVLHGTTTVHTVFPHELHHLPTALAKQTLSQAFGAIANLVNLVTSGVVARFPRLQVVVADAGLAWLPLVRTRLDHYFPYLRDEAPFLEPRPSEAIRRQVYLTTHPLEGVASPSLFAAFLEEIGPDHLLFGSDWPHFDATTPEQIRQLPISDESRRQILGANARALFRLG